MNIRDLPRIANEMRRELNGCHSGIVERFVDRTLIQLRRNGDHVELFVGRKDICPDLDDAELIAGAFLAGDEEPTHVAMRDCQGVPIKAIRYAWSEAC